MGKLTRSQQKIFGRFIIGLILICLVGTAFGYALIAFLIFIALNILWKIIKFFSTHSINWDAFRRQTEEEKFEGAFNVYDEMNRKEYEAQAEEQFSSQPLKNECDKIYRKVEGEADKVFKKDIENILAKIGKLNYEIRLTETNLSFFSRNYKQELDKAYEKKATLFSQKHEAIQRAKELKMELSTAQERKAAAYETIDECRDDIDSWYAKSERSPWLLGNAGSEIPRYSFFGQSHGDLEDSYNERHLAYTEAHEWKKEIGDIKKAFQLLNKEINALNLDINETKESITESKAARAKMYELKEEGQRKENLQPQLKELHSNLKNEQVKLKEQNDLRAKLVEAKKKEFGTYALQNKMKEIQERKAEHLKSFNLEENKEIRKAKFRSVT